MRASLAAAAVVFLIFLWSGCGGSSHSTSNSNGGTQPGAPGSSGGSSSGGSGGTSGSSGGGTSSGGTNSPGGSSSSAAQYLYTANLGSPNQTTGSISGFSIDANSGALSPVPASPFAADFNPNILTSDSKGKFLFVGESGFVPGFRGSNCLNDHGKLLMESVSHSTGELTKVGEVTLAGSCPTRMVVDPSGQNLYVGDVSYPGGDFQVEAYAIVAAGNLVPISGSPYSTTQSGNVIAIRPDGKTVYVAGASLNSQTSITAFHRDTASGALSVQQNVPIQYSFDLAVTPAGDYLILALRDSPGAGTQNNTVVTYSIDSAGNLTRSSQVSSGNRSSGVDIDPLGKFVVLTGWISEAGANGYPGTVSTYQFTNGMLSKLSSAAAGNTPWNPRFESHGNFVFVPAYNDAMVNGFRIDRGSGALTPVSGAAKTGDFPGELTIVSPE